MQIKYDINLDHHLSMTLTDESRPENIVVEQQFIRLSMVFLVAITIIVKVEKIVITIIVKVEKLVISLPMRNANHLSLTKCQKIT